jgi:hypothetical protein
MEVARPFIHDRGGDRPQGGRVLNGQGFPPAEHCFGDAVRRRVT